MSECLGGWMKSAGELRLSAFGPDPLLGTYNPHASEGGAPQGSEM